MWPRLYLIDSICVNKYKAICFHVLGFKFQNPKDKLCKTQVVSKSWVLHFFYVWGMYINIRAYLLRIRNSSISNPWIFQIIDSIYTKILRHQGKNYHATFLLKTRAVVLFLILDVDIIILWYIIFDIWFFVKRVDEMYWKRYYIKKISNSLFLTAEYFGRDNLECIGALKVFLLKY